MEYLNMALAAVVGAIVAVAILGIGLAAENVERGPRETYSNDGEHWHHEFVEEDAKYEFSRTNNVGNDYDSFFNPKGTKYVNNYADRDGYAD